MFALALTACNPAEESRAPETEPNELIYGAQVQFHITHVADGHTYTNLHDSAWTAVAYMGGLRRGKSSPANPEGDIIGFDLVLYPFDYDERQKLLPDYEYGSDEWNTVFASLLPCTNINIAWTAPAAGTYTIDNLFDVGYVYAYDPEYKGRGNMNADPTSATTKVVITSVADGKISGSATAELQEEKSRVRATVTIEFKDLLITTNGGYQMVNNE
jgi:hypothetical protein